MNKVSSIFLSAGDPSADYPGKLLIDEIKRDCPDVEIQGLGGPLMQQAGLRPLADHRHLAVLGFWEVLPKIRFFNQILKDSIATIRAKKPGVVVLLDYPGFNLRLARRVKTLGLPIVYYISPQIWAWGKRRLKTIKELVDLMLVIFPFEVDFYQRHDVKVQFVGHPVVDRFNAVPERNVCRMELSIAPDRKLVALLPGSRRQEVGRMLPSMAGAATLIERQVPHAQSIIGAVDDIEDDYYLKSGAKHDIAIVRGKTPQLLSAADLVITSSGTATIETAYFRRPMVVIYKTGWLTYQIARRLVTLDAIGMVNIMAGKKVVPELIQREATPSAIAYEAIEILKDRSRYNQMVEELGTVRDKLGSGNTGVNVYGAIRELVTLC